MSRRRPVRTRGSVAKRIGPETVPKLMRWQEPRMAEQSAGLASQMRVLHKDVIGRIALLHEGLTAAPKRRPTKK
jgi:hypothetical protein